MFTFLKEYNIPPGPLADPVTMYQVGRGKIHARSLCNYKTRPVDLVLWDVDIDKLCERCTTDENLPHRAARTRRTRLWREMHRLEEDPRPTGLSADAVLRTHSFWSRLELVFTLLAATGTHPAFTFGEPQDEEALNAWVYDVYVPRATARLDAMLEEFAALATADWPVRFASIAPLGFHHSPVNYIVGPTPTDTLTFGTPDHALVSELRIGMLYKWFTTAEVPDHGALVEAALAVAGDRTSSTFTNNDAAEEMAYILLEAYLSAVSKADVVYQWGPTHRYTDTEAEPPPILFALLSQAQIIRPLMNGGVLILPRAVVDVLPHVVTPARLGLPAPWRGAIYGRAQADDTADVLADAANLVQEGFAYSEALKLSRLSHTRPAGHAASS